MAIARIVATRATCDRLYQGAVLVKDKRIMSTGYNGAPEGLGHCDQDGHLLEEGHCVRTIHGEHNTILQAAVIGGGSTKGSTLYALYSPCIHCAKYIAAAGVVRVVIGKMYRNNGVIEYLKQAGIQTTLYVPAEGWNENVAGLFAEEIPERREVPVTLTEAQ